MQNENSNSRNWKQKLENIDDFPTGMRMNKENAWSKLDAKIQRQPKRRKAFWYWVAAACLLPLLLLLFPTLHHKENNIVKESTHTNNIVKPSVKERMPVQKEVVISKAIVPVVRKKALTEKSINVISNTEKKQVSTLTLGNDSTTQNIAAITTIQSDSNDAKAIASTKLIKKLKVVHNNELNDPAEAAPLLAHTLSVHSFPLQIARGEVHGNDVKAIHNTSFISFKTKPLTN